MRVPGSVGEKRDERRVRRRGPRSKKKTQSTTAVTGVCKSRPSLLLFPNVQLFSPGYKKARASRLGLRHTAPISGFLETQQHIASPVLTSKCLRASSDSPKTSSPKCQGPKVVNAAGKECRIDKFNFKRSIIEDYLARRRRCQSQVRKFLHPSPQATYTLARLKARLSRQ